jgi:hypothetical protein
MRTFVSRCNRFSLAAALSLTLVAMAAGQTMVRIYPDWPIGNRYQEIAVNNKLSGIRNDWNDKIKAIYVPWGCTAEVHEHDGAPGVGLGRSRTFPPGTYYVGDDFATIISTVTAKSGMVAYLNSADFKSEFEIWIGISADSSTKGNRELKDPKVGGYLKSTTKGVTEHFVIQLPSDSQKPKVFETTKAGDAGWSAKIVSGKLDLTLWANPKGLFGGNNWVGVGIAPGN